MPSPEEHNFEAHGWRFRTYKGSILSTCEIDEMCSRIATHLSLNVKDEDLVHGEECVQCGGGIKIRDTILQMPELLFGNNTLEIELPGYAQGKQGGFGLKRRIIFSAEGALRHWASAFQRGEHRVLKVREAELWKEKTIAVNCMEYDWTFTPEGYEGEIVCKKLGNWNIPILHFSDIPLYSDFLHDHGEMKLDVKIRIMDKCLLVLMRYWAYIFGISVRLWEKRWFHEFGKDSLFHKSDIREMKLLAGDDGLTHFKCSTPEETALSMDTFSQAVKRTTSSSVLKLTE